MVLTDGAGFPLWFSRQVLFDTLRQHYLLHQPNFLERWAGILTKLLGEVGRDVDVLERVRGRDDRVGHVPDGDHDLPGVSARGSARRETGVGAWNKYINK